MVITVYILTSVKLLPRRRRGIEDSKTWPASPLLEDDRFQLLLVLLQRKIICRAVFVTSLPTFGIVTIESNTQLRCIGLRYGDNTYIFHRPQSRLSILVLVLE